MWPWHWLSTIITKKRFFFIVLCFFSYFRIIKCVSTLGIGWMLHTNLGQYDFIFEHWPCQQKSFPGACPYYKSARIINKVCEWYLRIPAECPLQLIGQYDFELWFLDTILHWGHLSLYCDPALVYIGQN